jgi:ABC-type antimicrobial peptide transport system permease subunit
MDSAASYAVLRDAVKSLAESMPVYHMTTLASQLDDVLLTERLVALLSAGFGILATVLAAIGLYGVMAFVVTRRTKEMGVRMALGAHPSTVIWLVMKEVLILLGIGLAIGLPSALALGQYVASQLYEIKASDPMIATATIVVLFSVAALAGLIPARRASRIDPILALRYE